MTAEIGRPPPSDFALEDDVGDDALVLDREPPAGTAHPRLDLVGDEHDAVRRGELGEPGDEARRRHDEPTLALDRLDQDRGDVLLADVLVHLVDRVGEAGLGARLLVSRRSGSGTGTRVASR